MDLATTLFVSLLAHAWGDFCLQTEWMSSQKRQRTWPCLVHVAVYTACFVLLLWDPLALAIVGGTHFAIDRFSLAARYCRLVGVGYKGSHPWQPAEISRSSRADRLKVGDGNISVQASWSEKVEIRFGDEQKLWLVIVVDQIMHLTINSAVIAFLLY